VHRAFVFTLFGLVCGLPHLVVWLPIIALLSPPPAQQPAASSGEEVKGVAKALAAMPGWIVRVVLAVAVTIDTQAGGSPILSSVLLAAVVAAALGCLPAVAVRAGLVLAGFLVLA